MFRPALRALPRATHTPSAAARRFLTTAPPHKTSRSWKNSALRWGLAGGLVYYYNTSNVFADEPAYVTHSPPETSREIETYPSLDTVAEQRRSQARAQSTPPPSSSVSPVDTESETPAQDLEQEADQQGAFNEETGEINWDCPCLGGMAHGPCGEQFRAAFSCFVYSQEEPKGIECIDKFKGMQDCFREHPDIYGAELDDTEAELEEQGEGGVGEAQVGEKVATPSQGPEVEKQKTERAMGAREQVRSQHGDGMSETDEVVPKAWHDTRGANTEK